MVLLYTAVGGLNVVEDVELQGPVWLHDMTGRSVMCCKELPAAIGWTQGCEYDRQMLVTACIIEGSMHICRCCTTTLLVWVCAAASLLETTCLFEHVHAVPCRRAGSSTGRCKAGQAYMPAGVDG
jgi:hypothetical protein